MKVVTESIENRQTVLNIEVEPEEMEKSLDNAYHRLVKGINVPGFRKGKAPRSILENYVGREELQKEALDALIPQLCNQAIEEQKIDIIAQPQIEVLQVDPIVIQLTCSLRPEVKLGEYHNISLAPEPYEVKEEQIDSVIERIREQQAMWDPVERSVAFEDLVVMDIEERIGEESNTYEGQQYQVTQDSMLPLPGFAEELIGISKDEEKKFSLSYPDEYKITELAGKQYDFTVKVTEIKEKHLPELNDELAKSLGEGFETLDALRESVINSLKNAGDERAKKDFEQKVIDAAVDLASVEFPPILVEHEIDHFLSERERMLGGQGGLEYYLKNMNKTKEEMREEIRPEATRSVIQSLVIGKIAEEEKIEASAAEIDAEIEGMLQNSGENAGEMQKVFGSERGRLWIEERLTIQKTVQRLTEIATGDTNEVATGDITELETGDTNEIESVDTNEDKGIVAVDTDEDQETAANDTNEEKE